MKRARTLVFGASHWHAPLYADGIAAQHEVLGLSDPDRASVEDLATLWGAPLYSSWEELLSRHQDAELAYVFVPHDIMRDVCLALIALGIPMVVEKPVGVSLQELTEVERPQRQRACRSRFPWCKEADPPIPGSPKPATRSTKAHSSSSARLIGTLRMAVRGWSTRNVRAVGA